MTSAIGLIVAVGMTSVFFYLLLTTPADRQGFRGRSRGDTSGPDGGSSSDHHDSFNSAGWSGHSATDSMGNPLDSGGSDGGSDGGGGDGGGGGD
ncbi:MULTISPECIES: hypothetical protein [unclassified Bradyrhizobium]|uniref:hypothetical protein n=1 Tax=unclassified Bradyrhizobium TaxID=2631580 RepID=UPI002915D3D8|nr:MULTISPECIES: hypothetical protein [unclassified Bradyrhizobium]